MAESLEELPDAEAEALHAWLGSVLRRDDEGDAFAASRPWHLHGSVPTETPEPVKAEFAEVFHAALRALVPHRGFVHFVDEQHVYARFYPHRKARLAFEDIVVDGETASFVAVDRSWGILSIGWTYPWSIDVFGEPLVSRLRARRPALVLSCLVGDDVP